MKEIGPGRFIGNGAGHFAVIVPHEPITDRRLSLADLGLYLRCLWLLDICGELGDIDWFIKELDMPEEDTRAGIRRLVEAGYLELLDPAFVAARIGHPRDSGR